MVEKKLLLICISLNNKSIQTQQLIFNTVNFWFSFVLNSLAYYHIHKQWKDKNSLK